MERFFHPESWSLLMVDDEKRDLYYALARGVSDEALQNIRIPLGTGMAGWVALDGEPLIVARDGNAARLSSGDEPHSAICLPLRSRERTLGVLQVTHPSRRRLLTTPSRFSISCATTLPLRSRMPARSSAYRT